MSVCIHLHIHGTDYLSVSGHVIYIHTCIYIYPHIYGTYYISPPPNPPPPPHTGAAEISLAQAAFPAGRFFSPLSGGSILGASAPPAPPHCTPQGPAEDRASLRQLGIPLTSCAMHLGALTSRKKEFKPMVDAALGGGWAPPTTEAAPLSRRSSLRVDTRLVEQQLSRVFSVVDEGGQGGQG